MAAPRKSRRLRQSESITKSCLPAWGVCLALTAICGIAFLARGDAPLDFGPKQASSEYKATAFALAPESDLPPRIAAADTRNRKEVAELPSYAVVVQNPTYWLGKARQGDPVAAVAVYLAFRRCVPEPNPDQADAKPVASKLPPECGAVKDERRSELVSLLRSAADAGDSIAQLHYGSEILHSNLRLIQSSKPLSTQDRQRTEEALALLETAASQGSVLALMELAHGFDTGASGRRDAQRSLAYFLALQQKVPQTAGGQTPAERLAQELTPSQVSAATKYSQDLIDRSLASRDPRVEQRRAEGGSSAVPPL